MKAAITIVAVPLVGPFHTRFPRYNAVDVRDAIRAADVSALALAPLSPGALADPAWQATDEVALPLAVVPWARRAGLTLLEVGCLIGAPDAPGAAGAPTAVADAARFEEVIAASETGKQHLQRVKEAQASVEALLTSPLDAARVQGELLAAVDGYQRLRSETFGEGPGTGWLDARASVMAERLLSAGHARLALLASIDELSALIRAVGARASVEGLPAVEPSPEARDRALLDHAMRGDAEDPGSLLDALRRLTSPEAAYLEGNVLLEHAHLPEALEALKKAMRMDFQEPYYLPGFVLARLGQVYDLVGRRADAVRSYRGVLALGYAPPEALEVARSGLEAPFGIEVDDAEERDPEAEDAVEGRE